MIREGPARPPKRPQLVEAENGPNGSYVTYGAFNHGGRFGVTNQTAASPELTKKLTRLLRRLRSWRIAGFYYLRRWSSRALRP